MENRMKAAVYKTYGKPEVVKIEEVDKPIPLHNEILVKVRATTVTAGDWRMRAGNPYAMRFYNGWFRMKRTILGHEFSGVVESIGTDVTKFNTGDQVFGYTGAKSGAHAEYVIVPADGVVIIKPKGISDRSAAALPVGASTALYFLRKAHVKKGQKVLVYGASGSVGSYAVQLAKFFGAKVTGVCSQANSDLVLSLGADRVIDYRSEDFSKSCENYDVVFDAVGKTSFGKSKKVLKTNGTYLTVAMSIPLMFQTMFHAISKKYHLFSTVAKITVEELQFLSNLLENKELNPVIDTVYPLKEIYKAHHLAETGRKKGNIVIENNPNDEYR